MRHYVNLDMYLFGEESLWDMIFTTETLSFLIPLCPGVSVVGFHFSTDLIILSISALILGSSGPG